MFGGRKVIVTAIRRNDDTIEYFEEERKANPVLNKFKKIPFVRGIVGLIEASANGSKHLNFSTERYDVTPGEEQLEEDKDSSWNLTMILGVAVVGVLSFIFGKLIFTIAPAVLADVLFTRWVTNNILQNLIEGVIKILLLLAYLFAISQTPLIKRLFQYHGAEHKVINTYEAGVPLTVDNVQGFSRLHYRCGSSFIIFTVIVGVVIYSFFQYDTLWERIYQRILLLPVVIGVSYEVLQFSNKLRDVPLLRILGYPGLWLQKLTTKEPEDKQVEVAIASFEKMIEMDRGAEFNKQVATTG
ncbi:DUF1385 domain-containing protein [Ammoniphilus sp. CFH 90114]|uniref:DUF1385 domain-containing protein n=1 Tax=Ammoniphilus sp. CFH 90114 TaxID=2493665 RepID=UPI00100FC39A|nr:DUF1385 domain-containing protein [Ammoniphilus sp. CFH 90114]RXT14033.1 DUF1385 domain-containing protein [Ammoniphilus sp. CFH 90114]